ncbi:MAG: c-type cytochrome [Motiliproteus sp.]
MKKVLAFATAALLSTGVFAGEGETVFNKACVTCHAPAAASAMGAPAAHDAAAWAPRLADGIDAAVASAKAGKGGMPPKGLCMDCSDDQLKAAIEFMSK